MNILICLPKDAHRAKENIIKRDGGILKFCAISRKPKDLRVADHVFFIVFAPELVVGYYPFVGFSSDPICEITGKQSFGLNLLLAFPPVLIKKRVAIKPFSGFRCVPFDYILDTLLSTT